MTDRTWAKMIIPMLGGISISTALIALIALLVPWIICAGMFLADPALFTKSPNDGALDALIERVEQAAAIKDYPVVYERRVSANEYLFPEATHRVAVSTEAIIIHEYASPDALQKATVRISPDGRVIQLPILYGLLIQKQQAFLHMEENIYWFQEGRFIISYVGYDPNVVAILVETFGLPFAGDNIR